MGRSPYVTIAHLTSALERNLTRRELAEELEVSLSAVSDACRREGVELGPPRGARARALAVRYRLENLSPEEIAQRLQCDVRSVYRHLSAAGLTCWHARKIDREQAVRLHEEGVPVAQIAERFGVNPGSVSGVLREAGISSPGRNRPKGIDPARVAARYAKLKAERDKVRAGRRPAVIRTLAEEFGVNVKTIHYHLVREGAVPPPEPYAGSRYPQVLAAAQAGMTASEIARVLRVSRATVTGHLRTAWARGEHPGRRQEQGRAAIRG